MGYSSLAVEQKIQKEEEDKNKMLKIEEEVQKEDMLNPTDEKLVAASAAPAALPIVDLPITRKRIMENQFLVTVRRTFVEAQARDSQSLNYYVPGINRKDAQTR